jgi:hypothetical protein
MQKAGKRTGKKETMSVGSPHGISSTEFIKPALSAVKIPKQQ